jgi:uncharacterized protein (TIGR03000 family)
MYSAVLMLALTAGNEAIDFGKHRCHGGSDYGCSGAAVVANCPPACSHAVAARCHGGTVGYGCSAPVAYGCSTACHSSCHGGLFARMRERKCHCQPTCSVAYGCATTYGCTSGVPVVPPPMKKEMPKGEKIEGPKKASVNVPATIVISLPADARLIVDGASTSSTSERRTLVTPVLEGDSTYVYTMQAEVTREGRVLTQTQQVTVRGGETSNVQFNFSAQSVASR